MRNRTAGFTLIELLIVVVIVGILAAIAIPKFAATKDKAKLASVRSDLRNIMTAEEAYFADNSAFANFSQIQSSTNFTLSGLNAANVVPGVSGYTATVSNSSITTGFTQCKVTNGLGAALGVDGVIICS
jgi:prepilin-type N-terminal cleavage/methylation domain-containing protein